MFNQFSEEKDTALITGGASGIGWSTACALSNEGVKVIICDNSSQHLASAKKRNSKEWIYKFLNI